MSVEERLDRLGGVALRAAFRPAEGDNVVGHVLRMRATRASSQTTYLPRSPRIGSGPAAGRLPDPRCSVSRVCLSVRRQATPDGGAPAADQVGMIREPPAPRGASAIRFGTGRRERWPCIAAPLLSPVRDEDAGKSAGRQTRR